MPEKLKVALPDMQTDMALTIASQQSRRDSNDSGMDSPVLLARRSTGIAVAMKRSGSDSLQRPRSGDGTSSDHISEQTQLLFRKMLVLEKKVQSMETQLKEEQVQRLTLEAKVVKLEEENQDLKQNRERASKQLQSFADKFYVATEDVRLNAFKSSSPSPYPSLAELRTVSRRNSASSVGSVYSRDSTGSRYSALSVTSQS